MSRILILTPQLPYPPHQGTTIRNFNLIAGLAQRHTLDLLTFTPPDCSGAAVLPSSPLTGLCRQILVERLPVRSLAARTRDMFTTSLPDMALRLASPALHAAMTRLLAANDYDVVQVEGIEMARYALAGLAAAPAAPPAPGCRPRLVFDDHNAEYVLQQRNFLTDARRPRRWPAAAYSLVQWQKLRAYERRICRASDRVVAVSEADRASLHRLMPDLDVTVVPNGVDLDFYRPGVIPPIAGLGPDALVFTGKMDYRPNIDAVLWFVEAVLPLIRASAPQAHFYVVGQQPHARLAALTGHPAVTVTGAVPDVRPYIAAAGAYVIPLRIGGGTRLKVLEAMAMGQAIVSTRLGCDGFPFEDSREVRLADTPADFAAATLAVLRDHEQAARLGRAARDYVSAHYGWERIVPLMERMYE
jgi:sugar transferase (PEP-CTERM/EpsH1 system associated)